MINGTRRGFVWTPATPRGSTGTLRDIGTLGGVGTHARAVNGAGYVVGLTSDAAGVARAYLWTAAAGMKDLGFRLVPPLPLRMT